ncbi:MAG: response regulator [Elusimicrobia bacterium]|nr:response regulator [Elusimicrobiota bacterium]
MKPMRVLIVDDWEENRELLKMALETEGIKTLESQDGVMALRLLKKERVDCVISDILMPNLDGYGLCRKIRADTKLRRLPIVIYSNTFLSADDKKLALASGADRYVCKSGSLKELLAALREVGLEARKGAVKKRSAPLDEAKAVKLYSEALVKKLEAKNLGLEEAARKLRDNEERLRQLAVDFERIASTARSTAMIIAAAPSIQEAAPRIIRILCETLDWDMGSLWWAEGESGALRCAGFWRGTHAQAEEFEEATRSLTFRSGVGLPGRVRQSGKPVFVSDLARDFDSPRLAAALKAGLREVLAVPLDIAGDCLGVMEFFSGKPCRPKGATPAMLETVAVLIGLFIKREEAAQSLRQKDAELLQARKLESIGRLAGGIAHDFNNILTAVLASANFLKCDLGAGTPKMEDVEAILRSAQSAADVTRQLLAFSRRQVLEPRILDLGGLVRNMEKILKRLVGEDVELVVAVDSKAGKIKADSAQVEQILLNLFMNARDAMPKGGRLTIETGDARLDDAYASSHPGARAGRYAMLAVSDTGIGMDEETQARVFDPFFTTKNPGRGTGLGLSSVYGIMRQSGGHVSLYSVPGRGTTFKAYFPVMEESAAADLGPAPEETPKGTETVLLVEDDAEVRAVSRRILAQQGYTVIEARSAEEGEKIVLEHPGEIHLLLTDLVMPGADGLELARRVGALRPKTKTLLMSGYTERAATHQEIIGFAMHYLQKPFSPDDLAWKVRQVLDEKPPAPGAAQ